MNDPYQVHEFFTDNFLCLCFIIPSVGQIYGELFHHWHQSTCFAVIFRVKHINKLRDYELI